MTIFFEYKVLDDRYPVVERYTVSKCKFYYAHGRNYLKLYKNNSEFDYDFCIDLSGVKSFLIED